MKKEIKIALIVTLILAGFIWGFNFLKGKNLFSSYNYYYAEFSDIQGMQTSAPVLINGYQVGLVSDIQFSANSMQNLMVEVAIKKDYDIPKNSALKIESELLGGVSLLLQLSNETEMMQDGDMLKTIPSTNMLSALLNSPTVTNFNTTLLRLDSVLCALNSTLNPETQENIQSIVANIDLLVKQERPRIDRLLANTEAFTQNLQANNENITKLISNLESFSENVKDADVKALVENLNQSLSEVQALLQSIEKGEGSLGKLVSDEAAYNSLQKSLEDLDKLLIDIKENPKRYINVSVFGGKKDK